MITLIFVNSITMLLTLPLDFLGFLLSEWISLKDLVTIDLFMSKINNYCKNAFQRIKQIRHQSHDLNKTKLFTYLFPLCSYLEKLSFGAAFHLNLTKNEIRSISTLFPHLTALSIKNQANLTNEMVAELLKHCPKLCELDVEDNNCCDSQIEDSALLLFFSTRPVKKLNVAGNSKLTYSFTDCIDQFHLIEFTGSSRLTEKHILKIASTSPNLQALNLNECRFLSCSSFNELCLYCPHLLILDVEQHLISDVVLREMSKNCLKLTHLFFRRIKSPYCVTEIGHKLKSIETGFPLLQFISFGVEEERYAHTLLLMRPALTILKRNVEGHKERERPLYFSLDHHIAMRTG